MFRPGSQGEVRKTYLEFHILGLFLVAFLVGHPFKIESLSNLGLHLCLLNLVTSDLTRHLPKHPSPQIVAYRPTTFAREISSLLSHLYNPSVLTELFYSVIQLPVLSALMLDKTSVSPAFSFSFIS